MHKIRGSNSNACKWLAIKHCQKCMGTSAQTPDHKAAKAYHLPFHEPHQMWASQRPVRLYCAARLQ